LGGHGLTAVLEIDDLQAYRAERYNVRFMNTLLIGSSMNQRIGGAADP